MKRLRERLKRLAQAASAICDALEDGDQADALDVAIGVEREAHRLVRELEREAKP